MTKKWKRGEKAATVIETMEQNRGKSYDQIVGILVKVLETTEFDARAYYRYMVRHGKVDGFDKTWKMGKPAKTGKVQPRKSKKVADKLIASIIEKSADEIAEIKAKNLQTMKGVTRVMQVRVVRDFTETKDEETNEYDPHLERGEIDTVLQDLKLVGQIPVYAHKEG